MTSASTFASRKALICLIAGTFAVAAFIASPTCKAKSRRRSGPFASGAIVAYEGGSGGGSFTLMVKGRFRTYSYDEPVNWRGFRHEEDLYLGSIITIRQRLIPGGRKVRSIEYRGAVDPRIRGVWNVVTKHFEALAQRDYKSAYSFYSRDLQAAVPYDVFVSTNSAVSQELHAFVWVPPNPLARYGLLSYGIGLRSIRHKKATARVAYSHSLPKTWESRNYEMIQEGPDWKIHAINGPN